LTHARFVGHGYKNMDKLFYVQRTDQSPSNMTISKRSSIVRSISDLVTQRASIIRALYIVSVATNGPRDEILAEFHQAVGDVLEGVALSQLDLAFINKMKVKEEAAWLRDRNE
jgi:hypothetical protein